MAFYLSIALFMSGLSFLAVPPVAASIPPPVSKLIMTPMAYRGSMAISSAWKMTTITEEISARVTIPLLKTRHSSAPSRAASWV